MSFILDRKREHEGRAADCVRSGDYAQALFHAAQVAELGFQLAEQGEGKVADKYAEDATGWVALARQLKAKAKAAPAVAPRAVATGAQPADDARAPQTWQLREKPTDRLDDVAGLSDVKEQLRQMVIEPFLHPEVYKRFSAKVGGGVLMYGPPGNGKTYIARAVAGELDAAFFLVDSAQIKDKYVGETEKRLTSLFDEARQQPKSVIFFDEVDDLLSQRGNQKIGTVTTFLKLADGFVKSDACLLVLAATNKPWLLSPAVLRPGRLGTHIYVGLPDLAARRAILEFCFKGVPLENPDLDAAAGRTEGYSGAEIADVCNRAKMEAIKRQIDSGQPASITPTDLDAAMAAVPPQTDAEQMKDYDRWRYGRSRGARDGSDEE